MEIRYGQNQTFEEIHSLISNNLHLSVRSSMSCGVLIFVSSFPCVSQWLDARHDATIYGEKCFGTFTGPRNYLAKTCSRFLVA